MATQQRNYAQGDGGGDCGKGVNLITKALDQSIQQRAQDLGIADRFAKFKLTVLRDPIPPLSPDEVDEEDW